MRRFWTPARWAHQARGIVLATVAAPPGTVARGLLDQSIVDTIGRTPIGRINRLAPEHVTMCVEVEAANPGGSVKDRLALGIIEDAERRGVLKAGADRVRGDVRQHVRRARDGRGQEVAPAPRVRIHRAPRGVEPNSAARERGLVRSTGRSLTCTSTTALDDHLPSSTRPRPPDLGPPASMPPQRSPGWVRLAAAGACRHRPSTTALGGSPRSTRDRGRPLNRRYFCRSRKVTALRQLA